MYDVAAVKQFTVIGKPVKTYLFVVRQLTTKFWTKVVVYLS